MNMGPSTVSHFNSTDHAANVSGGFDAAKHLCPFAPPRALVRTRTDTGEAPRSVARQPEYATLALRGVRAIRKVACHAAIGQRALQRFSSHLVQTTRRTLRPVRSAGTCPRSLLNKGAPPGLIRRPAAVGATEDDFPKHLL